MTNEQASRVLLVDDDEFVRARLEALLEVAGFEVTSVDSCQAARIAAAMLVFPLIILDRGLADGDGIDLIADLRRLTVPNRVYIMMLTALDSEEAKAEGLKAGADDYLSKRGSDEVLLDHLRAARNVVKLLAS